MFSELDNNYLLHFFCCLWALCTFCADVLNFGILNNNTWGFWKTHEGTKSSRHISNNAPTQKRQELFGFFFSFFFFFFFEVLRIHLRMYYTYHYGRLLCWTLVFDIQLQHLSFESEKRANSPLLRGLGSRSCSPLSNSKVISSIRDPTLL